MNNKIQAFIDFLLDTETTTEISFSNAISESNNHFYDERYRSIFEEIINQKLQLWKNYHQNEQRAINGRVILNTENEDSDTESEDSSDQQLSTDNDEEKTFQSKVNQNEQVNFHLL